MLVEDARAVNFGHFTNMIYSIDTVCGTVFYKSPLLREGSYICELLDPHSLYGTALFGDHHPNKPPSFEETLQLSVNAIIY